MVALNLTNPPEFLKALYSEAKAFKSPQSFLTLSIRPRVLRVLANLEYFKAFCPDRSKILYPTFSDTRIRSTSL